MLDEYECHAIAGSQRTHELPAGIEATGRRTDADDWKILRVYLEDHAPKAFASLLTIGWCLPVSDD